MVKSVSSSEPAGPLTTTNSFGNLNFDPSPMGSTSAPSSLNGAGRHSAVLPSPSGAEKIDERREKDASEDDSQSDSCSSCGDDEAGDFDASWIELSAADLPSVDGEKITEKFDNLLTSLSKIDVGTSVGPSLNPGLADLEQQLIQLREDNLRLLAVLEATNEAMKKNLTYAQELKSELKSSHSEYDSLRSSADSVIVQLRSENAKLRQRVSELEAEIGERDKEPVAYHQFDLSKEMNMQEMSSQIASRDIKISKMNGEIRNLTAQLERARSELSRSASQQSLQMNQNSLSQQILAFNESQSPTSPNHSMKSSVNHFGRTDGDDQNNRNSIPNDQSYMSQQNMMAELNYLRSMVEKLLADKKSLEDRLNGRRHKSSRHSHRAQMGTSYTANTSIPNPDSEQAGTQFGNNNMETDANESHHHGRHRRHHRHHSSKGLRRLEKKLARTGLPVINSAVMFKGFTTFSTQPQ